MMKWNSFGLQSAQILGRSLAERGARYWFVGTDPSATKGPDERYRKHYLVVTVTSLCTLLAFVGLQVSRGNIYFERWMQDIFIPLEGALHLQYGHRPHVDSSSPAGIFYILPHYVASQLAPLSGMTIVYANGLVGVIAFVLAATAGFGRLPILFGGLFSLYVGLVAISPRWLGRPFDYVLYNASYNRYGWCFLCVLCLIISLPRLKEFGTRACNFDGILTGLLLFVLFYEKATYSLVGIGLVAVSSLTVRRSHAVRYSLVTLASFLIFILMMELATGITRPYFAELITAAAVQPDRIRFVRFVQIASGTHYDTLAVLVIGLGAAMVSGVTAPPWRKLAFLLAIVVAGIAVATQNHPADEIPTIPVVALIAVLLFWQFGAETGDSRAWRGMLCVAVVLVFVKPMALDSASLLRAALMPTEHTPDTAWLQDTALHDLVVRQYPNSLRSGENSGPFCCENNDSEYLYLLSDGVKLLRRHMSAPATVFSLTWSSPFPTLLGLAPVKHNLLWWDPKRTFNETVKPPGAILFKNVDFVLIPKVDISFGPTKLMREVYADDMAKMFTQIDESRFWILLSKR